LLSREELEQIPVHYRLLVKLLLKLPNPEFPHFILKKLPEIEGVFWALVVPILLTLYFFFSVWLFAFLTWIIGFPLNIVIGFLVPAVIFVFFLRTQLERAILFWRSVHEQPKEWETSKRVEKLMEIFNRPKRKK